MGPRLRPGRGQKMRPLSVPWSCGHFSHSSSDAAAMLWRQLDWKGTPDDEDDLVSWTSSLLFAVNFSEIMFVAEIKYERR